MLIVEEYRYVILFQKIKSQKILLRNAIYYIRNASLKYWKGLF